ncbi:DUF1294 domain-containing protein [Lysinibacillus odysseyi]|uniref:DUF1294 domain-containing protein n=1 Tax=Lysinibacillus odysseyi 34hs-1 = NBRC 100172 TaxID=1220589 RepID=A0A0A3IKE7_9BACI|nr:DUF1294 domain-containing protein [Lysinibacillus odysseyi]KGR83268.1 hypothetical protein CD32_15600 [Lysinibacillus odysseyi 34hs-1 = NBRC 100172]
MDLAIYSYVGILSLVLLFLMYNDKQKAIKKEWRIAEKTLFTLAITGGAIGGVLGMYLFRHKTKHNTFAFGFPLLAAIQVFIIVKLVSM